MEFDMRFVNKYKVEILVAIVLFCIVYLMLR